MNNRLIYSQRFQVLAWVFPGVGHPVNILYAGSIVHYRVPRGKIQRLITSIGVNYPEGNEGWVVTWQRCRFGMLEIIRGGAVHCCGNLPQTPDKAWNRTIYDIKSEDKRKPLTKIRIFNCLAGVKVNCTKIKQYRKLETSTMASIPNNAATELPNIWILTKKMMIESSHVRRTGVSGPLSIQAPAPKVSKPPDSTRICGCSSIRQDSNTLV